MDQNNKNQEPFLTHIKDQTQAAVEDASAQVEVVSKFMSFISPEGNGKYDTDDWPNTYMGQKFKWLSSREEFFKTKLKHCRHINLQTPSVFYINMFDPTSFACVNCALEIASLFYKKAPGICDFCFSKAEFFHESMIQIGVFIVSGNVCTSCYDKQKKSVGKK